MIVIRIRKGTIRTVKIDMSGMTKVTCNKCDSIFAFDPRSDPEVERTNESDLLFDCPVCGVPYEVQARTG